MIADELITYLLEKYKDNVTEDGKIDKDNLSKDDSKLVDLYIRLSKADNESEIKKCAKEILKINPDDIDVQISLLANESKSGQNFLEKLLVIEEKYKDDFYKRNEIGKVLIENVPLNLSKDMLNRPFLRLLVQIGLTSFHEGNLKQAYDYFTKVYNFAPMMLESFHEEYALSCIQTQNYTQLDKLHEILPNSRGAKLAFAIKEYLENHDLNSLKERFNEINPYLYVLCSQGLEIGEEDLAYCMQLNPYLKGSITEALHLYSNLTTINDGAIINEIVENIEKTESYLSIFNLMSEEDFTVYAYLLKLFDNDSIDSFTCEDFLNGCLGKPCEDKTVEETLSNLQKLDDEKMIEHAFNTFVEISLLQKDEDKKYRFTETTVIFHNTFVAYLNEQA